MTKVDPYGGGYSERDGSSPMYGRETNRNEKKEKTTSKKKTQVIGFACKLARTDGPRLFSVVLKAGGGGGTRQIKRHYVVNIFYQQMS